MSESKKIMNKLFKDCKEQLLTCKREASITNSEIETIYLVGRASGIYLIFAEAHGYGNRADELREIFLSVGKETEQAA